MANPLFHKTYQHVLDDDVVQATEDRRPSLARDFRIAKLILSENSDDTGDSLYDHLVAIIKRTLDERPPNVIDYFEDFSRQIKEERYKTSEKYLQETYIEPIRLLTAKKILATLIASPLPINEENDSVKPEKSHDNDDDDDEPPRLPIVTDLMQLKYYWSLAGIGFPQDKIFLLSCCIEKLKLLPIVRKCRFWGQIYGLSANYYIAEVDLTQTEIDDRLTIEKTLNPEQTISQSSIQSADPQIPLELIPKRPVKDDDHFVQPPLPKSQYKPAHEVPDEPCGIGLNRKTYFVCNQIGDDWEELPLVTCAQIIAARKIKKFFTGNLDAPLLGSTYPAFYEREENYLRATIARITASTFVAPKGFYSAIGTDDDEDDDAADSDDEATNTNNDKEIEPSDTYEPLAIENVMKSGNWVHCHPHILTQGRVNWFNLSDLNEKESKDDDGSKDGSGDDDSDNNDSEKLDEIPEIGPALFAKCSEDKTVERITPWTIRMAHQSERNSDAIVVMQSNIWPGAVSLTMSGQRVHDFLYIGWGQKFVTRNYSPPAIPNILNEWRDDEIMQIEMIDPSVADEEVISL